MGGRGLAVVLAAGGDAWGTGIGGYLRCNGGCGIGSDVAGRGRGGG